MKNFKKIISILMMASITIVSFSGCGSSMSTSTKSSTNTANAAKSDSNKNGSTKMKTLYSNVLKTMVNDSTITQIQSDKVLDVVTKDPKADGTKPGGTPPKGGNRQTGTSTKGGTKPTGKAPQSDKLSELVTSKVISQTQADTINRKFQEAMKSAGGTNAK